MTEAELIQHLKAGGRKKEVAADAIFQQYDGLIKHAQKKHKLNEEEAFDAYSDTIIAIVKQVSAGEFEEKSKLSTYLQTIFFRRCVDQVRKKSTNPVMEPEPPDSKDLSPNAEARTITREEVLRLKRFMEQLSGNCKELLMLRYYWGYEDMGEIAEKIGIKNANTAGSLRHRCMKKLMDIIASASGANSEIVNR
ncbi:MAG: RNA polymerase sigma factor [Bacteroidia bacterium]